MIYFLFGEMGAGKNHVGERFSHHLNCEFFDGDTAIPPSMAKRAGKFLPLPVEMLDNYVRYHLIPAVETRYGYGRDIVVGQALYLKRHRDMIRDHFGDEVKFVWLPITSRTTHMKRLLSREKGIRWAFYGLYNAPFFQEPSITGRTNDDGIIWNYANLSQHPEALTRQFQRIAGYE